MGSNCAHNNGEKQNFVAAIGGFDGLHRGHAALLHQAKQKAQMLEVPLVVFTFAPLPKAYLKGDGFSGSLFNPESNEKEKLLTAAGVDRICTLKFDEKLAHLPAHDFIDTYLRRSFNIKDLFVGENFTFGEGGKGAPALLQECFEKVTIVPLLKAPSSVISSSTIRQALLAGDVEKAEAFLGRPYSLSGIVVHGKGQGRALGFPTANVHLPKGQLVPQSGVYAAEVTIHGSSSSEDFSALPRYMAAVNIGTAPTLGGATQPILEAHLLDFSDDLYGKTITVALKKQLRQEKKFSSVTELVDTVQLNIDQRRKLLGGGK